jgi:cysteine-rich repeat protein
MPLCGNGRIDTKADYKAFYASTGTAPLSLTRAQLMPQNHPDALTNPNERFNLTLWVDEECDDGNRVDLDGCSADCLHLDLWTFGCEIAVEWPSTTTNSYYYEDVLYDVPQAGATGMVVSTTDGVYALTIGFGDAAMKVRRIAPKAFAATSLFRRGASLYLYDPKGQALWQVPGEGSGEAVLVRDLSTTLQPWTDRAYVSEEPNGPIILHDHARLVYLATVDAPVPIVCIPPANSLISNLTHCLIYIVMRQEGKLVLNCNTSPESRIIFLLATGGCVFDLPPRNVGGGGGGAAPTEGGPTLWAEALRNVTSETGWMRATMYGIETHLSPPSTDIFLGFFYIEAYIAMGALISKPMSTPRWLGTTPPTDSLVQVLGYTGKEMYDMLDPTKDGTIECTDRSSSVCAFDAPIGYDLLRPNPMENAVPRGNNGEGGWQGVLQAAVAYAAAAATPMYTRLTDIRQDKARFDQLLDQFGRAFRTLTAPLQIKALVVHPITKNMWAIRGKTLVEISKTGVQMRRDDGRCVPAGMALCAPCSWGINGGACKPCTQSDTRSWAWNAQCSATMCPLLNHNNTSKTRRLLLTTTTTTPAVIVFSIAGNFSIAKQLWPQAVETTTTQGAVVITVTLLQVKDPVKDMQAIRLQLHALEKEEGTTFRVLMNPTLIIPVATPPPPPSAAEGLSTAAIVGVVVAVCVVVVAMLALYFYQMYYYHHHNHPHNDTPTPTTTTRVHYQPLLF